MNRLKYFFVNGMLLTAVTLFLRTVVVAFNVYISNKKTMVETIISRLADERGVDEDLKARDMLRWVAEMNNIKVSAEEIVLREVVYV